MNTPRAAALALCVLLAPAARAGDPLPAWSAADEAFTSWPAVTFNDDPTPARFAAPNHRLHCRRSECDPPVKIGLVNLYELIPISTASITATITRTVERTWDPRTWLGRQTEEIESVLTIYDTKLSHYKLDLAAMQAVQGTHRFAAYVAVNQPAFSAQGSRIRVNSPRSLANDVWRAAAAGRTQRRGGTANRSRTNRTAGSNASGAAAVPLTAQELRWLTLEENAAHRSARTAAGTDAAALGRAAEQARARVRENLRPGAVAGYQTAVASGDSAAIDAALSPVKMWGENAGPVTPPVDAIGPNTEIQLTAEEYNGLNERAKPARDAYIDARTGLEGRRVERNLLDSVLTGGAANTIDAPLDLIVLHRAAVAARAAWAAAASDVAVSTTTVSGVAVSTVAASTTTAGGATGGADVVSDRNLTADEQALLDPDELRAYQGMLRAHNNDETNQEMRRENARLRGLIRGRTPYRAPADAAAFAALQDWQKKKFCAELPGAAAAAVDQDAAALDNSANARAGLANTEHNMAAMSSPAAGGGGAPSWAADACAQFRSAQVLTAGTANGGGRSRGTVPSLGTNLEHPEGKPSPWLAPERFKAAANGALVGMLLGAGAGTFGGVLVGALAGAALFYLVSKLLGK